MTVIIREIAPPSKLQVDNDQPLLDVGASDKAAVTVSRRGNFLLRKLRSAPS